MFERATTVGPPVPLLRFGIAGLALGGHIDVLVSGPLRYDQEGAVTELDNLLSLFIGSAGKILVLTCPVACALALLIIGVQVYK
ncbi:hypothetical protein I302_101188 [Kwoniella bestiolae CBS 10118]|uniref:Uncharacterized protein n=1 Tax=Kwoniella bestiolae CBS 10118 TaxID=1296100 RepID=A0A1B9G778_9TREE|nr:hypothetical protein I302_04562 [Kwoniella bestiolae CBS 10118]OCF26872.1 hypothetical protein I302_04562 [Kwoniella bestiolae CBS 10118]